MQYFVTIYINPMAFNTTDIMVVPHAFLGLTHTHPDELDKIDNEIKMQKLNNADWKDIDKRWYESLETNEYNDGFGDLAQGQILYCMIFVFSKKK